MNLSEYIKQKALVFLDTKPSHVPDDKGLLQMKLLSDLLPLCRVEPKPVQVNAIGYKPVPFLPQ